jgi:adenylate cyclase class 2
MSTGGPHRETEIKLRVASAGRARRLLARHAFRILRRRVFETNTVFDTLSRELYGKGCLLRVRTAGRASTLTYKGRSEAGRHKSREEVDIEIGDAAGFALVLERLGFRPMFRYEKYRTEYSDRTKDAVVTIDETPIGVFLELEGPPDWIDGTAERLGFSPADYTTASYATLYMQECAARGKPPADMVFA